MNPYNANCPLWESMNAIDCSYTPMFENTSLNMLWESKDEVNRYIAKGLFFTEYDVQERRAMVYKWLDRQLWNAYQKIGQIVSINERAIMPKLHRLWMHQNNTFTSYKANQQYPGYVSLSWSHGRNHDKGELRVWVNCDVIIRSIMPHDVQIFVNGESASQLEIVWGIQRELRAALEQSTWFDEL